MNKHFTEEEGKLIVDMITSGYGYEDVQVKIQEVFGVRRSYESIKKKMARERVKIKESKYAKSSKIRHCRKFSEYHIMLTRNCLRAGKSIKNTARFVRDNTTIYYGSGKVKVRYWSLVRLAIIESRKRYAPKGRIVGYLRGVPFYSDEQVAT